MDTLSTSWINYKDMLFLQELNSFFKTVSYLDVQCGLLWDGVLC